MTGYPWQSGDELLAQDLNAAIANATALGSFIATGSTTARSPEDRAHDWINVLDFGAKLDGTTYDDAAFAAARTATANNGSIFVPRGTLHINTTPTAGPAGSVLWRMDGLTYDGTTPVNGMGTDIVENLFPGAGKYFGRTNSFAGCGPVLRVDETLNHSTGTAGTNGITVKVNTSASGASPEGVIGLNSTITTTKTAGGDNVAMSGYANRNAGAGFANLWGANFYAQDMTGHKSSLAGSAVGAEIAVIANDLDDYSIGIRVGVDVVGAKAIAGDADVVIGWGVRVSPSQNLPGVSFNRHFAAQGPFLRAAYSTEGATQQAGANAIWLGDNHTIALNAGGTQILQYRTATSRLYYTVSGVDVWSVDAAGNVRAKGTLTGSTTP